jgi:hypothetical protein
MMIFQPQPSACVFASFTLGNSGFGARKKLWLTLEKAAGRDRGESKVIRFLRPVNRSERHPGAPQDR